MTWEVQEKNLIINIKLSLDRLDIWTENCLQLQFNDKLKNNCNTY